MKHCLFAVLVVPLALAAGCGEEDLIDDSQPSERQVRSLIHLFQLAAADEDDETGCALMDEQMRRNTEGTVVLDNGQPVELPCGLQAALHTNEELRSLPDAKVVYITINRHDENADVQLDNGTFLYLRRAGESADGEWRIDNIGYRPSPADWEHFQNPLSESDPRAAARRVNECLENAGFNAKVLLTDPADTDAPDAAVAFQRGTAKADGGEVAIYESGVEAVDKLEGLENTVEGFNGTSEPRGRAGVIFFGQPEAQTREAVLNCVR